MLEGWKPLRRCNLAIAAHDIWRCQEKRCVPTAVNKQLRNSSKHCNVYNRQCGNEKNAEIDDFSCSKCSKPPGAYSSRVVLIDM